MTFCYFRKKFRAVLLGLFFVKYAIAQSFLGPEEAIQIALLENLGIKIAQNNLQIAKNEVTKGNAGQLPTLNLVAGLGGSNVNTRQVFANGQEQNRNFASAINGNVGVQLAWTLYDGKRMYRTFDRLAAQAGLSEMQLQLAAENLTLSVLHLISEAVRQQQIIVVTKKTLTFYDERIRLAQARLDAGTIGKPILLQTQIDLNVQKSLLLQAENALAALKVNINQLIVRPPETDFFVQDTFILDRNLSLETLLSAAESSNRQLRLLQQTARVAEIAISEAEAARKPQVALSAQYNFARAENQAGFLLSNQNYGLAAGLTMTYNLFDGSNRQRIIENAKILASTAQLSAQENWTQIRAALVQSYSQWQTNWKVWEVESQNLNLVQENLKIAEERFRLGGSDILPLREAQKSYDDAQIRLINARYQIKLSEIRLFQLSGRL